MCDFFCYGNILLRQGVFVGTREHKADVSGRHIKIANHVNRAIHCIQFVGVHEFNIADGNHNWFLSQRLRIMAN